MNKIDVSTPSTTVLSQYPGYNAGDQYLTQIATFTIWVDTTLSGTANIVLPPVSAFRLGGANFKIFDVAGNAGNGNPIVISFEDGALVNGADSITLNTNYGNIQVQLQDGEWFANLNGTGGGGGGITGANNGLSVSGGSLVQLGGSLIHNTVVNGLDSFRFQFLNADNTFRAAFGNLTGVVSGGTDKCLYINSATANQAFVISVLKDNKLSISDNDLASGIQRGMTLISTSALLPSAPTGAIRIAEAWSSGTLSYALEIVGQTVGLQIVDNTLATNHQITSSLLLSATGISCSQYIDITDSNSLVNGWAIGAISNISALFWNCTQGILDGTVLQLDGTGLSLKVSSVDKFLISPTGQITATLPTSSAGLTTGMLWNNGNVVNIIP